MQAACKCNPARRSGMPIIQMPPLVLPLGGTHILIMPLKVYELCVTPSDSACWKAVSPTLGTFLHPQRVRYLHAARGVSGSRAAG